MSEYHEMQKDAAEARIGADRMAMGLSCIPDPLRGDMAEIERLQAKVEQKSADLTVLALRIEERDAEIERLAALEAKP